MVQCVHFYWVIYIGNKKDLEAFCSKSFLVLFLIFFYSKTNLNLCSGELFQAKFCVFCENAKRGE